MDYFYCNDCHEIFSEEEAIYSTVENVHWWLDDKPVERWTERLCPYCRSDDLEECEYCDYCGEPFPPGALPADGMCAECRKNESSQSCG